MKARIHWNKQRRCWTVHTYKGCEWGTNIEIVGPWMTETKPNSRSNPRGFVVCERKQIVIHDKVNSQWYHGWPLFYDKDTVWFNFIRGRNAYFTLNGVFVHNGERSEA